MSDSICSDLRRYIGQPVNIFTEDGHIFHGTVIHVYEDSVRIIERNEDILLIPFRHIVAIQQPKMCCERHHRECCGGGCGFEGFQGGCRDRDFFEDRGDYRRDRRDYDDCCCGDRRDYERDCCC